MINIFTKTKTLFKLQQGRRYWWSDSLHWCSDQTVDTAAVDLPSALLLFASLRREEISMFYSSVSDCLYKMFSDRKCIFRWIFSCSMIKETRVLSYLMESGLSLVNTTVYLFYKSQLFFTNIRCSCHKKWSYLRMLPWTLPWHHLHHQDQKKNSLLLLVIIYHWESLSTLMFQ